MVKPESDALFTSKQSADRPCGHAVSSGMAAFLVVDTYSANEDEEKGFYPWMFGSEFVLSDGVKKRSWEVYKEAAKEKLKIERTYVEIVDASSRGNLREIHSEYVSYLA